MELRLLQGRRALQKIRIRYLLLLRVSRLGVVVWITGWCFPAQSRGKMTDGGIASTKPPLTPPAAWNRSCLQPLYAVGRTASLARPKYRSLDRRRFAKGRSEYNSSSCMPAILPSDCRDPRHPTSWFWTADGPPTGRLCGWVEPLAFVESTWGNRLSRKKEDIPSHLSRALTSSPSDKDRIIQETLPIVTSIQCPSVVFVTLCLHLTRRPDHNTAVAPCNLTVNDHEIRVMLMCCYPQCGLGPDAPEGGSSCLVPCCTQYEFLLRAREVNHPRLVGLKIACAAPFSEVVPYCEELTGVYPSLVPSRPSAVLGTVLDIFLRRVDPPRATDVKGKIPVRRANRLSATELKMDLPARGLGPLCTTASGDRMTSASRLPATTTRAPPSIGGVDVGVRIPLCEYGLVRRTPVRVRRLNFFQNHL